MQKKAAPLVSLLVLGCTWTLQGLPVLPEPLYPTQENFDLARFLGTWHDVAVATTCPFMLRHRADAAMGKLVLETGATEGKLKTTKTVLRHGSCKEMAVDYELTSTPGRFSYHVSKWGTDVDAYVVHTNYDEYAIMILKKHKSTGEESTSIRLYSRTTSVRATVLDDFKTLVREQGMADDSVIIKQDKGDCVPGQQEAASSPQTEPQRTKRSVVASLASEEVEGSADFMFFNGTEACEAKPETGPCFGMHQRYFYNSSSMSCELFKYGGCLGNQNNFETERECLQRCRTEAVCRLPLEPRSCSGQPPIWAFDSNLGVCMLYKKDYCQANANMFYSKAECDEYCGVVKDDDEGLLKSS